MKSVRIVPFLNTKVDKLGFHIDIAFQAQVWCDCGKFYQIPSAGEGIICEPCEKMYYMDNTEKTFSVKEEFRKS